MAAVINSAAISILGPRSIVKLIGNISRTMVKLFKESIKGVKSYNNIM